MLQRPTSASNKGGNYQQQYGGIPVQQQQQQLPQMGQYPTYNPNQYGQFQQAIPVQLQIEQIPVQMKGQVNGTGQPYAPPPAQRPSIAALEYGVAQPDPTQKRRTSKRALQQQPDVELGADDYSGLGLSDERVRRAFIRKVLVIIAVQMIITSLFVLAGVLSQGYRDFINNQIWLLAVCTVVTLISLICIYCYRNFSREVPKNYILLFVFTFAESYLISCITSSVSPGIVLLATGILAAIVLSLSIYAYKTDRDISQKITFFIYGPIVLLVLIIVGSLFLSYIVQTIITIIIIIFFSIYLVFDIQRLCNKQDNNFVYDYDDYIIAALDIYIDIIIIFQELIYLLSR